MKAVITDEDFNKEINRRESRKFEELYSLWQKRGSHKGDSLWKKINELTGDGDFLDIDWGNELITN